MVKPTRATLQARGELAGERTRGAELEQQNARLGALVEQQAGTIKALQATNTKSLEERDAARRERDEATKENTFLRDRLIGFERDNSALQGRIEILRELMPVTDRERYEDTMPKRLPLLRDMNNAGAAAGRRDWYRRF